MQHRADDNAQQPLASVLDTMQQTPLVRLDRLTRAYGVSGTILAKLDYLLPGFSKKDRAAKGVIEAAEAAGQLVPNQTVVELTSGNTVSYTHLTLPTKRIV